MPRRTSLLLALAVGLLSCTADDGGVVAPEANPGETSTTTPSTTTAPSTTAPPPADGLNGFVPEPLQWERCGGGLECATLAVPLDWNAPGGSTIDLGISRRPASDGDAAGGVAFNPGGPGASGNAFLASGQPFSSRIADRLDVLTWDPRGMGDSAPLGCDGDQVDDFVRLDSGPDDAAEQAALDDGAQAIARACQAAAGDRLPFMGTTSVARDLEAIRRAYGQPLAYVGFSYGTAIGLHHLELFPGTMTAVVLDGVVDPAHTQTDLLRGQTEAVAAVMDGVFAGCPAGGDGCPPGGAEAAYDELAGRVESEPVPAGDDRLGPSDLATAATYVTYAEALRPALYEGLAAALDGDGRTLLSLAESYRASGAYDLYQAVSCTDSVNPTGGAAWAAFADELEAISPRFGPSIANEMLPCAYWPVPPVPVNHIITAPGSGPVLVIGTTGDAATPVAQAERVAASLEDGHLLVYDGEGHTAYLSSTCVQEAVADFLLEGALPAEGARC